MRLKGTDDCSAPGENGDDVAGADCTGSHEAGRERSGARTMMLEGSGTMRV